MSDYTAMERLLHHLALRGTIVSELSFELEKWRFSGTPRRQDAVYVCGLARAGTTTLMRAIHGSGQFASLTYDDMPFVLAPNTWAKVSRLQGKRRVLQERAHGDGIRVDFDSPEALEEVFWRLHCGDQYILEHGLIPHAVASDVLADWQRYQSLVCRRYGRRRYLAKNNNLILRLADVARHSLDSTYLVLFRHPFLQAASLLAQHRRFRQADAFTRNYMGWLAHHEFGATHRPFLFSVEATVTGSPDTLHYWLQRWVDAYDYLLGLLPTTGPHVLPVSYERLCQSPAYWERLCEAIGIPGTVSHFEARAASVATSALLSGDDPIARRALSVYERLADQALASL